VYAEPDTRRLAGYGRRACAWLIDAAASLSLVVVGMVGAFALLSSADPAAATPAGLRAYLALVVFGVFSAVAFALSSLLMIRRGERNGQTLGKQLLGLRVVRDDRQPFGLLDASFRELILKGPVPVALLNVLVLPVLAVSYLWPLRDRYRRAGHDLAAHTHVIRV